jgi:bacterioferritin-associated ferredoxin
MYVCLCNAITDRDVCAKAALDGCTVSMIYRSLGSKPRCGKCVATVRQMLRQVAEAAQAEPLAALS